MGWGERYESMLAIGLIIILFFTLPFIFVYNTWNYLFRDYPYAH